MKPIEWEDSDRTLVPPPGTAHRIDPLPILNTRTPYGPAVVSCWELDKDDLAEVAKTGRVYLMVMGTRHPPVIVTGAKPYDMLAANDPRLGS